ncbi:TPA: hypothetical protein ACN33Q_000716 [Vibrio parahaemolyticus]|nr:response regulator [Vibrio parahaemolyticus]
MKMLIIEDNDKKLNGIIELISSLGHLYEVAKSRDTAQNMIDSKDFKFVILDMTLPEDDFDDSNLVPLAGMDILEIMHFEEIHTPTVILTGYDRFGRYDSSVSIDELKFEVNTRYDEIVKDIIYYDGVSDDWREKLKEHIENYVKSTNN